MTETALTTQDFDLLLQANRILSSKLEIDDLLEAVMELAARVVKSEAASILLLDEKTNELYFNVAIGEAGATIKEIRLAVGEGVAGWVAQNKQPLICNDVASDPRWSSKADQKTDFKTRSILAVPIMTKGRLLGVVEAINKQSGDGFSQHDRRAFEAFASQAAVAIENSRLFTEVKGEKEKFATVFQEMSDGALMVDEAGNIRLMNGAAGTLFGISPDEAVGGLHVKHLFKDFAVVPSLEDVISQSARSSSLELSRKEGKTFYLSGNANRLVGDTGDLLGYLIVLRDVTDSKKEEMLKRNFLSLISHKLKTPLVTITGYAPLLLEGSAPLTDFQRKSLSAIKTQGLQLTNLVDKLLAFSLVESETLELETEPVVWSALIEELLAAMRPWLESLGAACETDPSIANLPSVQGDAERLREVVRNLIENAVKFNARGDRRVKISGQAADGRVRVTVEDNGPGIPAEEHARIFQKFYQIEDSFTGQVEGAGLGLALVKRIVEAHGGDVSVRSTLGQGTAFTLSLPSGSS